MRVKTRYAVLAAAASAVLAASVFALLTTSANAGQITAGSCQQAGSQPPCTVSVTIPNPLWFYANVTESDVVHGSDIRVAWSIDCDGHAVQSVDNLTVDYESNGVVDAISPTEPDPVSCSLQVTATTASSVSVLTTQVTYTPVAPVSSSSPSVPAPATVKLVQGIGGMCLTDSGNSAAARTKVVVWKCSQALTAQGWTYSGDELKIHGDMCVNAKGKGNIRSKVILWRCNGSANEIWVHKPAGEYALKANGAKLCLDDPKNSTINGTQLIVYTCTNSPNQRWSLP